MRILMLCTEFSLVPGDEWLTNELAAALQACGHDVQVVLIAWKGAPEGAPATNKVNGVDVLLVAPKSLRGLGAFVQRATKWIISPYFARRRMELDLSEQSFDLLLSFSPAVTVRSPVLWAKRHF